MLYLHWTDLIDKQKVPLLFNLFGQEYRELTLMDDETGLWENEIKALQELKKESNTAKKSDPHSLLQKAIESWQIAGATDNDIQRTQKAWQELIKNPYPKLTNSQTPLNALGDIDHVPD